MFKGDLSLIMNQAIRGVSKTRKGSFRRDEPTTGLADALLPKFAAANPLSAKSDSYSLKTLTAIACAESPTSTQLVHQALETEECYQSENNLLPLAAISAFYTRNWEDFIRYASPLVSNGR